jgi:hypothetical protein
MLDLEAARTAYWSKGKLVTYQQVWQEIRSLMANTYHNVINGTCDLSNDDGIVHVNVYGTPVARFQIK